MRRGLIDQVLEFFRKSSLGSKPSTTVQRSTTGNMAKASKAPRSGAPARDIEGSTVVFEYAPEIDGDPDPGEVVWTWVPYEDDPSQGKDRPVVIVGRRGSMLVAVPLTSKQHDNEAQVAVGTGSWDREGRPSYAKVERLLEVDPKKVRREGAILSRAHFDDVVVGVKREQSR